MKNSLLFLVFFLPIAVNAQLTTDDFESYNTGAFDGQYNPAQWEGWFGGASRAVISTDQAYSGTKSMRVFDDVATSTESDIVAKLGTLNSGVDTIAFWMYVDNAGTGAYYNLQHNYTGSAADWAAEFYFGIDTAFVQTDGQQFPFSMQSNVWFEQKFILDFTNQVGLYYHDGNLTHTWALNTNAAGGAGLNQINAINFYAHDNSTGSGSNAYYDDIPVFSPPATDIEISNVSNPTTYTQLTDRHLQPMSFSADITNIGGSGVTNVAVTFDVQDASGTSVFSETVTQASLSAGMSSTFTAMGTFVPSSTGSLTVNYDVTMTETDSDLSNNSLSLVDIFMITDSTHAKDNGNTISQVGIGAPGLIGHIYEFFNTDSISSVSIISSNNTAGDVLTAQIFATSGGVPTGAPIATSQSINYNGDTAETEYIFGFATPVAVDSGAAYFVAIEETTNNISVSYALDIFTPNTGFFSTDNGASWTSFDLVGFPISMYIRPNVTGVMPPVNTSQLKEFEGAFDIMPNPTRGLTTLNVEIENAQDIQVAVFDVTGKLVQAFTDANVTTRQYTIDLSNQTDGVYLVRLITNGQIVTKRVILNK